MIQYPRYKRHRFSSFQVIIAGFAAVDLHSSGASHRSMRHCLPPPPPFV